LNPVATTDTRAEFLRSVAIFSGLPEDTLAQVTARGEWVDVAAGDWLFREGDPGTGLFVLRSGRLEVVREAGDSEVMIRALSPGAVLGELAVLTGAERSASVRARRDSRLLEISSDAFLALLRSDADFAIGVTRTMAAQLQASRAVTLPSDPVPPVIAVVSQADDRDRGVADELAWRLGRWRTVKLLTAEEAATEDSFAAALDRWERTDDQVILAVGAESADEWRDFALRQADRVLVVARSAPAARLDERLAGADLALLGWPRSQPALGRWIDALDPRSVHKVREDASADEDLDSLARRLAGRSAGVVLSGGGARGFAHIGVLAELLSTGLPIDRVGGCSMGALVGALFACGLNPDEIEARMREELIERNPMSDYTIPLAALVRGRKAEAMLLRLFGDTQIEELPREFFCVSCDLVTSELIVHRRGALYVAVGASFCLPGIGPPVAADGRLLVDGGVLNNLPVETMAGRGEGPIIAVDVSSRFEPPSRDAAGADRPRLRRMTSRLRQAVIGWEEPLPSLTETITRTVVLGSIDTAEAAQRHANLVIAPAVQGIGLTEFERIDEIREQGAAAARAVLERLPGEVLAAER
jgi:NTE family protein